MTGNTEVGEGQGESLTGETDWSGLQEGHSAALEHTPRSTGS